MMEHAILTFTSEVGLKYENITNIFVSINFMLRYITFI
jgi:hypothetical protein